MVEGNDIDASFMNPNLDRLKYLGRDREVGKIESERRLKELPGLEALSLDFASRNALTPPMLLPKGSVAVQMAGPESDFDVAVVVEPGHIFTQRPDLWREYQQFLDSQINTPFKVEPRLIVESHRDTALRLSDLVGNRVMDDETAQNYLGKLSDLLKTYNPS